MARNNDRGTNSRRAPKDAGRRIKKKPCALCKDRVEWVDYKDVAMLRKYMSDRGKIRARRVSGNCTQHQRDVAIAIKTARELVLLPYTQRTTTERPGGRGRGGGGGGYGSSGGPGRRGRDGDRGPSSEGRPAPSTTAGPEDGDGTAAAATGAEAEAGAADAAASQVGDAGASGAEADSGVAEPAAAPEVVADSSDASAPESGGDEG
jgi:small subunit ribosomal protein S18